MNALSRSSLKAAELAYAVANEPVHDEPPAAYGHAMEVAPLPAPMRPSTGFQLSCVGLGLALILFHLGKTGGAMAPLHPASLVMLPGMLLLAGVTGYLAWRRRG
jgi:hypothetical protein